MRLTIPCVLILVLATSSLPAFQPPVNRGPATNEPPASPYVQRMMSLDRNNDGQLSAEELPGKLADLISKHDRNNDKVLTAAELSQMESEAKAARDTRPAAEMLARGSGPAGRRGRAGRGRRGAANAQHGSPLDAAQILKFALTFDHDGDGGLNATELQAYADALAIRRAAARNRHGTNANDQPAEQRPPGSRTPSADVDNNQPVKPRGLKADGSGDGGFGDAPLNGSSSKGL